MDIKILEKLHESSFKNGEFIYPNIQCGCFYCTSLFLGKEIDEYITESDGKHTATCPHCYIDSVLSQNRMEEPLTKELLQEMKYYYFR